jgi:DNA helicase-2/ATP-dependent DNA helicase PcrA
MKPTIILGPPGTGKTTSILNLVEESMARGTAPDQIALVTFTKRGADEGKTRAKKKFNLEDRQLPFFSTLHAMCYRQLGLKRSDLLAGQAFNEFAQYAGVRVTGRAWSDDGILTGFEAGDRILFMENLSRIRQVSLREQYECGNDDLDWNEVQRVSKALAAFKHRKGLLDFTDMLIEFVRMGNGLPIEELYVDESQDLSSLQWAVVDLLAANCKRVTVAGDDDQAIYRWAGADVEHLINMDGDVRVLGQSYRVPTAVQALANEVIGGVAHRRSKEWAARKAKGRVDYAMAFSDVGVDSSDVLVLARNTYVLKEQVMPALKQEGIIYEVGGKSSVDVKIMRAVTSWEMLRAGDAVSLEEARVMYGYISSSTGVKRGFKELKNYGDDGDAPITMRDLVNTGGLLVDPVTIWHEALDRLPKEEMSYMLAARRRGEKLKGTRPRVRLSTIHSAKGAEAEHVVLMKEIAARTHYEMQQQPDDERRVWYVGATRAKERLTIVNSETPRECPWL